MVLDVVGSNPTSRPTTTPHWYTASYRAKSICDGIALLSGCHGLTQTIEKDPAAVVELGGANSWNLKGGSSAGGDAAVEFTPIENWLEIEIGELMAGIGPEWVHTRASGLKRNALGGEFALDFMYWPGSKHRLGWFVEPAFVYVWART